MYFCYMEELIFVLSFFSLSFIKVCFSGQRILLNLQTESGKKLVP